MADNTKKSRTRYPGSIPFAKDDEWVFFGRDDDIEKSKTRINIEKTIVLYGKSGLGKSSLLNAGVLPKLEKNYIIIPLRFGTHTPGDRKHPLDIIDQQLSTYCPLGSFLNEIKPEDISFWQHVKNIQYANPDHSILLVFDQFEEVFTYSHGLDAFTKALAEVLYNRMPKDFRRALHLAENKKNVLIDKRNLDLLERPIDVKVLMAIRSDRMSMLGRLSHQIPNILKDCYELKHLSGEQAKSAIVSPAKKAGTFQSEPFRYENETLEKILAYLTQNGERSVESFQLQILCQYIEKNIVGQRKDKVVKPVDIGNLASIYHDFYARTIKEIGSDQEQKNSRQLIEDGLIYEAEERRISLFEGQIESTYGIGPELLRKLVDTHIIRREQHGGGPMYELSHDSLVAPILKAKNQRRRQEEARTKEAKRRKENRKKIYSFILVPLILLIIFTIFFTSYRNQELKDLNQELESQKQELNAKALIKNANEQMKQSSQLGLLLARQAYRINEAATGQISSLVHSGLRKVLDSGFVYQSLFHYGSVSPVAFSPDGKKLATGSSQGWENVICLWDLNDPTTKPDYLRGHTGEIYSLAFSRTGKYLASAGQNGIVLLWTFDKKKHETTPDMQKIHKEIEGDVWSVAFSPDENSIAVAGDDKIVRLWDLNNLDTGPYSFTGHTRSVRSVAFSPDGIKLASGGGDNRIRLWDLEKRESEPILLEGHQDTILSIAFDPVKNRNRLASGSYDKTVRLWQLNDLNEVSVVLKGHQKAVRSVAFSPDGKQLASGGFDKDVRLWNLENPDADPLILTGHHGKVFSVAFGPGGDVLASGSQDKTARLWYMKKAPTYRVLGKQESKITAVALSRDGETLASGGPDKKVRLWKTQDGEAPPVLLNGNDNEVLSVAFSHDGRWLATGGKDKTVRLWDRKDMDGNRSASIVLNAHAESVQSVAFSRNNRWLASGSWDMTIRLWDLDKTVTQRRVLKANLGKVFAVAFSPDNRWLAAGSDDMIVRLWDLEDERPDSKPKELLRDHEGTVRALTFSPDSMTLASGSNDQTVRLWNLTHLKGDPVVLKGHEGQVSSLVFSGDGKTLISGSADKTVLLWNVNNPNEDPIVLDGHTDGVHGVAVSPDGNDIFSASDDKTIIQWIARPEILSENVCKVVTRNLSVNEWIEFVGLDRDYKQTCPDIPIHPSFKDFIVGLAIRGDIVSAETHLEHAQALDPDFELDINNALIQSLSDQGRRRAEKGDLDGAIISFEKAKALRPEMDISPEEDATKIAAEGLVARGKTSVLNGDLDVGRSLWARASELYANIKEEIREAEKQVSEELIQKGKTSAREGNFGDTVMLYEQAQGLNAAIVNDPKKAAMDFFVEVQLRKGKNLSRDGKTEEAIESFKKAIAYNPALDFDPKEQAEKLVDAEAQVRNGQNFAVNGKMAEAIESFKKAKAQNPALDFDPQERANMLFSEAQVRKGKHLSRYGNVKAAIESFESAKKHNPAFEISASAWNTICWYGCLWGYHAEEMVENACNKAVELEPKNGFLIDSRGIFRALNGDYDGAMTDFMYYVQWAKGKRPNSYLRKREAWIRQLKANENPFDPKTLESLKD